jgi:hypothetical protein
LFAMKNNRSLITSDEVTLKTSRIIRVIVESRDSRLSHCSKTIFLFKWAEDIKSLD